MSCENGDGSSNTSGIRQRPQPRSPSWEPVGSTCLPRFSRSGDSTSVEPRVANENAFSCDCHPESAPRRNTGPFEKSLRDSTSFNLSSASFAAFEKRIDRDELSEIGQPDRV